MLDGLREAGRESGRMDGGLYGRRDDGGREGREVMEKKGCWALGHVGYPSLLTSPVRGSCPQKPLHAGG